MIKTYRYKLKSKDQQEVHLPKGSLIKSVENKKDRPVLVYEVDAVLTREEHLAQCMKSWRFRLWYRWYGFLFKIKMMLRRIE